MFGKYSFIRVYSYILVLPKMEGQYHGAKTGTVRDDASQGYTWHTGQGDLFV